MVNISCYQFRCLVNILEVIGSSISCSCTKLCWWCSGWWGRSREGEKPRGGELVELPWFRINPDCTWLFRFCPVQTESPESSVWFYTKIPSYEESLITIAAVSGDNGFCTNIPHTLRHPPTTPPLIWAHLKDNSGKKRIAIGLLHYLMFGFQTYVWLSIYLMLSWWRKDWFNRDRVATMFAMQRWSSGSCKVAIWHFN